jgi:Domain of Unknown Function with PDB structure (DUF3857)
MKQVYAIILTFFFSLSLVAQKGESKDYKAMKNELNEKIFGSSDPYFTSNVIPADYKDESVVVIAQKQTLESDSRYKLRITSTSGVKYYFYDIFRKKLLINDQSALEEYSQLGFTKLQSKDWSPVGKLKNYTFINIRVIKPNGTTKTIDIDESSVLLKDEKDEKKNKIAIPDLSVGDILDYYVANYYQESDDNKITPVIYVLGDDHPILNYVISLQLDARIAAEYQCINGAPDFKVSPDQQGGGNVLSMAVKNIPKIKGLIWASSYRQLPIIRLNYKRGKISRDGMPDIREGNVSKATKAYADLTEANMASIMNEVLYAGAVSTRIYKYERGSATDAWKKYIKMHPEANRPDSMTAFLFRYMSYMYFTYPFTPKTNFDVAYSEVDLERQLYRISQFAYISLLEFKKDLELLVVSGKNSYERDNLFSVGDLSVLVRTTGPNPQYFSFGDVLCFQNTIPYYLQGEKAKVYPFDSKGMLGGKLLFIEKKESSITTLPSSDHKANSQSETILVKPDAADLLLMNVNRKVSTVGNLKKDEQAALLILEELALQTGPPVGETDDLITIHINKSKERKKEADEIKTLLEKARVKHKEDFEREIERVYDVKAKELKQYRITSFGMSEASPFDFEEEFVMEGWSKRAGNNYIVDIGKLIASQISIDKDQRQRTKDVYMPYPRSFNYRIEFTIPSGYSADGVEKLTMSVENEAGAFKSLAKLNGNKLIIDINKYYLHSFEPASKWPLLLSFLDKAIEFNQQKILLKKM